MRAPNKHRVPCRRGEPGAARRGWRAGLEGRAPAGQGSGARSAARLDWCSACGQWVTLFAIRVALEVLEVRRSPLVWLHRALALGAQETKVSRGHFQSQGIGHVPQ